MPLRKSKGNMYPYIAGFFDGEGGLFITKQIRKDGRIVHRLACSITNTNKEVMDAMSQIIGQSVYVCRYKSPAKFRYDIRLSGKKAVSFLLKIKPYVIAKKAQIDLALEFASRFHSNRRHLDQQELDVRDYMMFQLKILNGRKGGWPNALKKSN